MVDSVHFFLRQLSVVHQSVSTQSASVLLLCNSHLMLVHSYEHAFQIVFLWLWSAVGLWWETLALLCSVSMHLHGYGEGGWIWACILLLGRLIWPDNLCIGAPLWAQPSLGSVHTIQAQIKTYWLEGGKKCQLLAPVAMDHQFAAMFNSRAKSCCASNPSVVLKHTSSAEYEACMFTML